MKVFLSLWSFSGLDGYPHAAERLGYDGEAHLCKEQVPELEISVDNLQPVQVRNPLQQLVHEEPRLVVG